MWISYLAQVGDGVDQVPHLEVRAVRGDVGGAVVVALRVRVHEEVGNGQRGEAVGAP